MAPDADVSTRLAGTSGVEQREGGRRRGRARAVVSALVYVNFVLVSYPRAAARPVPPLLRRPLYYLRVLYTCPRSRPTTWNSHQTAPTRPARSSANVSPNARAGRKSNLENGDLTTRIAFKKAFLCLCVSRRSRHHGTGFSRELVVGGAVAPDAQRLRGVYQLRVVGICVGATRANVGAWS